MYRLGHNAVLSRKVCRGLKRTGFVSFLVKPEPFGRPNRPQVPRMGAKIARLVQYKSSGRNPPLSGHE